MMKKFLSVSCSDWAFNMGMLLLRLGAGALIIPHGYSKLVHFSEMKNSFMNFLGLGSTLSLILVIFAEFFCGMFVILGLFTRLTVIPLVITMFVALFKANKGDIFGNGAESALFLTCFGVLLLCGAGKASIDGLINR
jgi:putative oxidoreductase